MGKRFKAQRPSHYGGRGISSLHAVSERFPKEIIDKIGIMEIDFER